LAALHFPPRDGERSDAAQKNQTVDPLFVALSVDSLRRALGGDAHGLAWPASVKHLRRLRVGHVRAKARSPLRLICNALHRTPVLLEFGRLLSVTFDAGE